MTYDVLNMCPSCLPLHSCQLGDPNRRAKLCTAGALRAHDGRTAGICIKDHPKEKEEETSSMRMQQHNITI